jgi:hypothetical protein
MTADELTDGCWRARRAFNTGGSIVRRFFDRQGALRTPSHAVQYLLSNVISRRSILEKQGLALGGPEGLDLPSSLGTVPPAAGNRGAAAHRPVSSTFANAVS